MRRSHLSVVALCASLLTPIAVQIQAQTVGAVATNDTARVIVKFRADSTLLREQAPTAHETGRALKGNRG
jgi:hypothetical protein